MPPWVAKEKIETLLLASEMPVSIPRSRTVLHKDKSFRKFKEVEFSLGYQTNRRQFTARFDHMQYVHHVHESYSNGLELRWRTKHNGYFAIWFTIIT